MTVEEIGRPVTRLLQAGTLRLAKRSKKTGSGNAACRELLT
tara:strand:+ start:44 stop:166 length:123 start_codon:yes stop_codon:yes gene_type:complete